MIIRFSLPVAAAAILLAGAGAATAVPIKAQLTLDDADETSVATYIVGANAQGVLCSGFKNGANPKLYPHGDIKEIDWTEPEDWKDAWQLFVQQRYEEAATAMAAVYDTYESIRSLENSYSARAKFYQCESLRLSGQYAAIMDEFPTLQGVNLGPTFASQAELFNCWGHVGKELWAPLARLMREFEIPVEEIPAATIPPTGMPFKPVAPREIIQVAYLRGRATHMLLLDKREKLADLVAKNDERLKLEIDALEAEVAYDTTSALHDYSRGMTVTYGDEKLIMRNSMLHYLDLATEAEGFKENYIKQREAHVVALIYSQLFGDGKVPEEFMPLLEEPKKPEADA